MDDNTVQMFMNTCSPFTAPSARYHARGAVRGTRIGPRLEENTFGAHLVESAPKNVKNAPEKIKTGGFGGQRPPDIIPGTRKKKRTGGFGGAAPPPI